MPGFLAIPRTLADRPDTTYSGTFNITHLTPAQLAVLKAVLLNHNVISTGGKFDYAYNFAPDDRTAGTFAVGSDESLGSSGDPFAAFNSSSVAAGPNVWSLTFSATVTTIPEAPTWLMLMGGGAGLLVIRGLARRGGAVRRMSA